MSNAQDKLDTFYVALDKLKSIQEDISFSLNDMPFAENDDPIWEDFYNTKGNVELCEFAGVIDKAIDFASKTIHRFEDELIPDAVY